MVGNGWQRETQDFECTFRTKTKNVLDERESIFLNYLKAIRC